MALIKEHQREAAEPSTSEFGRLAQAWTWFAASVVLFACTLLYLSKQFIPEIPLAQRPVPTLVALLIASGMLFSIILPGLIKKSEGSPRYQSNRFLLLVLVSGMAARGVLFFSQPMLENDYFRYLWDGAVVAHGINPYEKSPASVLTGGGTEQTRAIAEQAPEVLKRIGHKDLTTIYPPVAQAFFATAHLIMPWSLNAWRAILLICDLMTFGLLIALLDAVGRSRLWISMYWLNPVVLKESFNSAHMEPVLLPFLLLALLLAWKRRTLLATASIVLASGVKLWPVALAGLIWRPLLQSPKRLLLPVLLAAASLAAFVMATLSSGTSENTGLGAYAHEWKTNSALTPLLENAMNGLLVFVHAPDADASLLIRVLVAAAALFTAVKVSLTPWNNPAELIERAGLLVAVIVLLSPAQYPWYTTWFAPFLVFNPYAAFRVLTATIPLYYLSFYFAANDTAEVLSGSLVWLIWLPVWLAAAYEFATTVAQRGFVPAGRKELTDA